VLLVDGPDPAKLLIALESAMQPVAAERVEQMSRVEPMKGPERLTPEVRAKIEAAAPQHAPAKPKKPRKLLVMDLTIAYPPTDHLDSGSAANVALRLAGSKSGAYEPGVQQRPCESEIRKAEEVRRRISEQHGGAGVPRS